MQVEELQKLYTNPPNNPLNFFPLFMFLPNHGLSILDYIPPLGDVNTIQELFHTLSRSPGWGGRGNNLLSVPDAKSIWGFIFGDWIMYLSNVLVPDVAGLLDISSRLGNILERVSREHQLILHIWRCFHSNAW